MAIQKDGSEKRKAKKLSIEWTHSERMEKEILKFIKRQGVKIDA